MVVAVAAAVAAAGIAVSLALRGGEAQGRPASAADVTGVAAHPDQSPPRELIAAGRAAVSAYYTMKLVKQPNGNAIGTYEWRLLNTTTERYEKTDWAWLDVAPGTRTAAVLERDLPVDRIGLLNLATGKVQRLNPDGLFKDASYRWNRQVAVQADQEQLVAELPRTGVTALGIAPPVSVGGPDRSRVGLTRLLIRGSHPLAGHVVATPLCGFRTAKAQDESRWFPVFTRR